MRNASPIEAIQICSGGRGVLYIRLKDNVDLNKYCRYDVINVTKSGIRAIMVKPAGRREVVVNVRGIHPSTKDDIVFEYLEKFGKIVTKKVIYGTFPEGPLQGITRYKKW